MANLSVYWHYVVNCLLFQVEVADKFWYIVVEWGEGMASWCKVQVRGKVGTQMQTRFSSSGMSLSNYPSQ
jgi:hypothetical protein